MREYNLDDIIDFRLAKEVADWIGCDEDETYSVLLRMARSYSGYPDDNVSTGCEEKNLQEDIYSTAIEISKAYEDFERAASLADLAGMDDEAVSLYNSASLKEELNGSFLKASEYAERAGLYERATHLQDLHNLRSVEELSHRQSEDALDDDVAEIVESGFKQCLHKLIRNARRTRPYQ